MHHQVIGKESAIQFAKLGANVVLVSRRKEKLEQVALELKKFNVTTLVCVCDVSNKDQVETNVKNYFRKI